MAKKMYNARPPASGAKVTEIQELYKNVYSRITAYEMKVDAEYRKNEVPKTLKHKLLGAIVFSGSIGLVILAIYIFSRAIQEITNPFHLSMTIMGLLIGTPLLIIAAIIGYAASLPKQKEVYIKFPLKKEEAQFNKLIEELGKELGSGSKLSVFISNNLVSGISFKKTLPRHVLFRGDNDDKSKRSFLFEVVDDEITVLLPDGAGVYQYDKKPKYDATGIPDANKPRYIAEAGAVVGDTYL